MTMTTPASELRESLEQLYDDWFYKFATEEPDQTYTLVVHEVHDGNVYSDLENKFLALISDSQQQLLEDLLRELPKPFVVGHSETDEEATGKDWYNQAIDDVKALIRDKISQLGAK